MNFFWWAGTLDGTSFEVEFTGCSYSSISTSLYDRHISCKVKFNQFDLLKVLSDNSCLACWFPAPLTLATLSKDSELRSSFLQLATQSSLNSSGLLKLRLPHKVVFGEMKRGAKIHPPSPCYWKRGAVETKLDWSASSRESYAGDKGLQNTVNYIDVLWIFI